MAITDLLWACPECGRDRGIGADGLCRCGVAFSRGPGASIRARRPDGGVVTRTAAEWVDLLPTPTALLAGREGDVVRHARVLGREMEGTTVVRGWGGHYLNRIERFGPERPGTVQVTLDAVSYTLTGGEPRNWPFDRLTAIQASSSTLQLRASDPAMVSFRFTDDSIFLWEQLLNAAVGEFYRRTGRGEVVEFQPRIVAR